MGSAIISETFSVPEMSCQHCVNAITQEVSAVTGVQQVQVMLETRSVTVEHSADVSSETIIAAINEAGFDEVAVQ